MKKKKKKEGIEDGDENREKTGKTTDECAPYYKVQKRKEYINNT